MRINRSLLNWGVFFIALGGIPLAVDQGWLESGIAQDLGQLWPLILVGIGLGLILRWTPFAWFGGALVAATFGVILGAGIVSVRDNDLGNLQGIIPAIASSSCAGGEIGSATTTDYGVASSEDFELALEFTCGELEVARAATARWSLEARHDPGDAPRIDEADLGGVATRLRLEQDARDEFVFLSRQVQSLWNVQVPADATLRVNATINAAIGLIDTGTGPIERMAGTFNASDVTVDLAEATTPDLASLDLTLNASDGRVSLPVGDINAGITLNASSLTLCVPRDAALRIDYSSVLGSDDLGSSGLAEERAGQWSTPGFADADDRISLSLTNTISSLSLERPEACS